MATIKIPRLVAKTAKHKPTRYYWQPEKKLRDAGFAPVAYGEHLDQAIAGCNLQNAAVDAWRSGVALTPMIRPATQPDTLGLLLDRYETNVIRADPPKLASGTIKVYRTAIARLRAWGQNELLDHITPARVIALRNANLPAPPHGIGHHPTHKLLSTARTIFKYGIQIDMIKRGNNPFQDVELNAPQARNNVWERDQEIAFVAAAHALGKPSMALAAELAIYSSQRPADLIAFTEARLIETHIFSDEIASVFRGKDGRIMAWDMSQRKTGTAMVLPIEPAMLEKITRAITRNRAKDRAAGRIMTHLLVDDATGLPYSEHRFIRDWQAVLAHAIAATGMNDMAGLQFRDFRRTRVVRLKRMGFANTQIRNITGHSEKSIDKMLNGVYGPVDPDMTAQALAQATRAEAHLDAKRVAL